MVGGGGVGENISRRDSFSGTQPISGKSGRREINEDSFLS